MAKRKNRWSCCKASWWKAKQPASRYQVFVAFLWIGGVVYTAAALTVGLQWLRVAEGEPQDRYAADAATTMAEKFLAPAMTAAIAYWSVFRKGSAKEDKMPRAYGCVVVFLNLLVVVFVMAGLTHAVIWLPYPLPENVFPPPVNPRPDATSLPSYIESWTGAWNLAAAAMLGMAFWAKPE